MLIKKFCSINYKFKIIFCIFCFALVPFLQVNTSISTKTFVSNFNKLENSIGTQGIDIENDTAFTLYGLSGDGSKNNPFLIENFIISTINQKAITISTTTKYFIIRNCTINLSNGIGLGIYSIAPGTGLVYNNTFTGSSLEGVHIENTNGLVLQNNNIWNNTASGVFIGFSYNVTFSGNNVHSNLNNGFYFLDSSYLNISHNIVYKNEAAGETFINCKQIFVNKNTIDENSEGIYFTNTSIAIIFNNTIQKSQLHGVYLDENSTLNLIYYNQFINNSAQSEDNGNRNLFYNSTSKKGNYWSDYKSDAYNINGLANNFDLYPLNKDGSNIPINSNASNNGTETKIETYTSIKTVTASDEFWPLMSFVEGLIIVIFAGLIIIRLRKRKNNH